MELPKLSPDLHELRNVILSSSLASCYLVLQELAILKNEAIPYEKFRRHWLDTYKGFSEVVAKMKTRKSSRTK